MKALIRFFTSLKVAIALFIALAAASILGTLIPQARGLEEYAARYGGLTPILVRLQITDLYHSVWFLGLLGLFGANILVCTLTRLGPKFRRAFRPRVENTRAGLAALKIRDAFKSGLDPVPARAAVEKALRAARYRIKAVEGKDGRLYLLGRKRTAGHFGSDFVHAGLLVILAGAIVTGIGGIRTPLILIAGETADVPGAGFALKLEKFETEFHPDGSVKDWKSTLTVLEDGSSARSAVIEVNHPLVHRGFSFYQSGYGLDWDNPAVEIRVLLTSEPPSQRTFVLRRGESRSLDDGTDILLRGFLPDFFLGPNNEPGTRSWQPNNPAALIEIRRGGAKALEGWIFSRHPEFNRMRGAGPADPALELTGFEAPPYSVIEAARDPGVPLIWIGCLAISIGLFAAFYLPAWEIRVAIESDAGKTLIAAGGAAAKSRDRFEAEFASVLDSVRRTK